MEVDRFNMRQIILDFSKQFQVGVRAAQNVYLKSAIKRPENIIICGMGGSALPGDILAVIKEDIFVHKSYGLPAQAGNKSLIICISYSGNTEETLSAFSETVSRKLPAIAITSGGKLAELCQRNKVPLAIIPPPFIPPRLALGTQFAALLQILINHNLLPESYTKEILKIGKNLSPKSLENQGKRLSKKIFEKIPIIYTSKRFRKIGLIWKNSLNETAKILAIFNYFPELSHNETVCFWKINERQISNKKLLVLILRDRQDHSRILTQMKISKDIINKEGVNVEFIDIKGKTVLEKIFSTAILGFWTSYYLALLYNTDPTPVKTIDELKQRLSKTS